MTEVANDLLVAAINRDTQPCIVWAVDENIQADDIRRVQSRSSLSAVTNRIDIQRQLLANNINAELSDFRFSSATPGTVDTVYFRIGKEKAIVHYVINRSAELLRPGGELVLVGAKNEGIKTYIKKAAAYLGSDPQLQRGSKSNVCATIVRATVPGDPLDDRQYEVPISLPASAVGNEEISFISKPGVYGWNKIDQGSHFLVEILAEYAKTSHHAPTRVVDLGCGYGYLSVMASSLLAADFTATDNNCTAIELCLQNFERHKLSGRVELADCGDSLAPGFDLVLCNPPFHQGFAVEGDLTTRFVSAAARLLVTGGSALFVVNSFIPLEKLARNYFSNCVVLANNKQFKVIELSK